MRNISDFCHFSFVCSIIVNFSRNAVVPQREQALLTLTKNNLLLLQSVLCYSAMGLKHELPRKAHDLSRDGLTCLDKKAAFKEKSGSFFRYDYAFVKEVVSVSLASQILRFLRVERP